MKYAIGMVLLFGFVCVAFSENLDVNAVLSNDRVLTNHIGCLLNENSCSPAGRVFKSKCKF